MKKLVLTLCFLLTVGGATKAEITGKGVITPNEVLGNIFKHFCVGK